MDYTASENHKFLNDLWVISTFQVQPAWHATSSTQPPNKYVAPPYKIWSPGTYAPLEWLHYNGTSNHKRNLNSQVSDCNGFKSITRVLCSKNIMITLTQSVPEECGLHLVWTFSPSLDCTIIWAAFNARNLVNLSKSFLSWILSLTVAMFRICINLI